MKPIISQPPRMRIQQMTASISTTKKAKDRIEAREQSRKECVNQEEIQQQAEGPL